MKINNRRDEKHIIWVDLLCVETVFLILKEKNRVNNVYFLNIDLLLRPFIFILPKIFNIDVIQINSISLADKKFGKTSLFEYINIQLESLLDYWSRDVNLTDREIEFSSKKFKLHIKERAYEYLYKPVEIKVISQFVSVNSRNIYFLKKSILTIKSIERKYGILSYKHSLHGS